MYTGPAQRRTGVEERHFLHQPWHIGAEDLVEVVLAPRPGGLVGAVQLDPLPYDATTRVGYQRSTKQSIVL